MFKLLNVAPARSCIINAVKVKIRFEKFMRIKDHAQRATGLGCDPPRALRRYSIAAARRVRRRRRLAVRRFVASPIYSVMVYI